MYFEERNATKRNALDKIHSNRIFGDIYLGKRALVANLNTSRLWHNSGL